MKPKFRSLIAAFAPLSRSSLIVCASFCAVTAANADQTWNGSISTDWNTVANWTSAVPSTGDVAIFDATSTANLGTLLSYDSSVAGISVVDPAAPVSLGTSANTSLIPWAAVGVDNATETITYSVAPITPLANGDRVAFTATTLPTGLAAATTYFVVSATPTTFKVSATLGGAAVNITANGAAVFVNAVTFLTNATDTFAYASQFGLSSPLANGNLVSFSASTVPTGMIAGRQYFVVNATATTYQVSETLGGAVVDFTTDGVNLRGAGNNSPRVTLGASGVAMAAATQDLTISAPSYLGVAQTWNVPTGRLLTTSAPIVGPGSITKTGAGNVVINSYGTYAGETNIQGGEVQLATFAKAGYGTITLDGAALRMAGGANDYTSLTNNLVVPDTKTGFLYLPQRTVITGTLTGAVDTTLNVQTQYSRDELNGNWSGFYGQLNISTLTTGDFRLLNGNGLVNAKLNLGAGVYMSQVFNPPTGSGTQTVQNIGELSGAVGARLAGNPVSGRFVNWTIGALATDSTYAGTIENSAGAARLTKVGSGTLTLSGTTTYSDTTTINAGALKITGTKSGLGATTVNLDATLTGTGSVAGTTSVVSGGHLSPGDDAVAAGIGTITTSNLTLATGAIVDLEFGSPPLTVHDTITLPAGGLLTLNPSIKLNVYDGTKAGNVSFGTNGTYPIVNFGAGATAPGFTSSSFVVNNGVPGKVYSFTIDASGISLVVSDTDPSNYWAVDGSGTWNLAASWSKGAIATGSGSLAKIGPGVSGLGGSFAVDPVITLDAVQTVGELTLNDEFGGGITIDPGAGGSLFMDKGASQSGIVVIAGSNTINAPVEVDAQGLAIDVSGSLDLTVNGVVSGTGAALTKTGTGTVTLAGNNTYDGGTNLISGIVSINTSTSLGATTGAATFTGGTLQLEATFSGDARSMLVSGANNALVNTDGFDYGYAGVIAPTGGGTGGLTKSGAGVMTLSNTQTYTGTTSLTGGGLVLASGAVINTGGSNVTGGTLTVAGGSLAPSAASFVTGGVLAMSSGGATFSTGLNLNTGNATANALVNLTGGTFSASAVTMGRCVIPQLTSPAAGATIGGFYMNDLAATATISGNFSIGNGSGTNSSASARIDSGSLTVGGAVFIQINSPDRWSVFDVNGGSFTSTDIVTGVQVGSGLTGSDAFVVRAGTATVERFLLTQPAASTETSLLNVSGGTLYVGSGGIVGNNNGGTGVLDVQLGTATLGAKAAWSTLLGATLNGTTTIQAADAVAAPFDIGIAGVLGGTGGFDKTGGGKLTLSGINTYTGNTTVSAGTLEVANDDVFDDASTVSIVSGATLNLTHAGTDIVGALIVNGITQPDGLYTFGTGKLQVGAVVVTPYQTWAQTKITDIDPLADATQGGDPDKDGRNNLAEFAFNGNPLNGADNGQVYVLTADSDYVGDPSVAKELVLTVAVRSGTPAFAGTPSPAANQVADDITYTIQGSLNLSSFLTAVNVVPTPVTTGLPAAGAGYEYRSFSLAGSDGLAGKGFLRAKVTAP